MFLFIVTCLVCLILYMHHKPRLTASMVVEGFRRIEELPTPVSQETIQLPSNALLPVLPDYQDQFDIRVNTRDNHKENERVDLLFQQEGQDMKIHELHDSYFM